jgi:hypothetical protein
LPSEAHHPELTPLLSIEDSENTARELAVIQSNTEEQERGQGAGGKGLTDESKTILLRICIDEADKYGHVADKAFWKEVTRRFKELTGISHKTLGRVVGGLVKARKAFLEALESGEQDSPSSYTDALDEWTSIVQARKDRKARLDEAKGTKEAETRASEEWRRRQTTRLKDRKRRRASTPSSLSSGVSSSPSPSCTPSQAPPAGPGEAFPRPAIPPPRNTPQSTPTFHPLPRRRSSSSVRHSSSVPPSSAPPSEAGGDAIVDILRVFTSEYMRQGQARTASRKEASASTSHEDVASRKDFEVLSTRMDSLQQGMSSLSQNVSQFINFMMQREGRGTDQSARAGENEGEEEREEGKEKEKEKETEIEEGRKGKRQEEEEEGEEEGEEGDRRRERRKGQREQEQRGRGQRGRRKRGRASK